MDWSNERWIRLYTRDTVNWKLLRWEGQTVLLHVMRKLDRSGVLDLGGVKPVEAVEITTGLPTEIVNVGFPRCIEKGVFVVDGDRLLMPNFLVAQEAHVSAAERQRKSRARREKTENVTPRDPLSHDTQPDVTPDMSHVTPVTNVTTDKTRQDKLNKTEERDYTHARACEEIPSPILESWELVRKVYSALYEQKRNMAFQQYAAFEKQFKILGAWCDDQATREKSTSAEVVDKLFKNYFDDEREGKNDWTPIFCANQPGRWYNPAVINSESKDENAPSNLPYHQEWKPKPEKDEIISLEEFMSKKDEKNQ